MMDTRTRMPARVLLVISVVSNLISPFSPPVARRRRPTSVPKMDSGIRWTTSAHCAGVVDLVCSGDISAKDGVDRLVVYRHVGALEQRQSAVSALQFLAHNSDVWIASATRRALHDRFVEDSWRLFSQNRDAMAQARLEYEEVVTDAL